MDNASSKRMAQSSTDGDAKGWWIDEPIRMALFLYNQYEAPVDTDAFVEKLVDLDVNAIVLPTGGVAAFYPTEVEHHVRAPSLPPGRDIVGEIVDKAHQRGIYVVARFEWTVNQDQSVLAAHPDWVQRDRHGNSPLWNDTHVMCINGGYMQDHIFKIMDEALARYPFDGIFFNYGGGQRNAFGPCQCDNCKRLYSARYGLPLPVEPDAQYMEFMDDSAHELAQRIRTFVKERNPAINLMVGRSADSTNSETHGAPIAEAHAFWLYDASETVNRARAAFPDRMPFNNDSAFFDGRWRYVHRSAAEGEIRAYQNMANGAGPYLFVNGNHEQHDLNGERGARPAFKFHRKHQDLYVRQTNAARVLLIDGPRLPFANRLFRSKQGHTHSSPLPGNGGFGYRDSEELGSGDENTNLAMSGFFRLLTENHIPFVLSSDLSWIDSDPGRYDLVIAPSGAPSALDRYLRNGGRVLAAGATRPDLDLPPTVRKWDRKETLASYWRVRDSNLFPSLSGTDLVFVYSDFLQLETTAQSALTLVPRTKVNPMEMVGEGMHDTDLPGLYLNRYGDGELAYLPWDIGELYFRAGAPSHSALFSDLVDHLLPDGRQIRTNAHPMLQITLQHQQHSGRTLVHLVNLSGASQVSYHPAIAMAGVQIELQGQFDTARAAVSGQELPIAKRGNYTWVTLPVLDTYDVIEFR